MTGPPAAPPVVSVSGEDRSMRSTSSSAPSVVATAPRTVTGRDEGTLFGRSGGAGSEASPAPKRSMRGEPEEDWDNDLRTNEGYSGFQGPVPNGADRTTDEPFNFDSSRDYDFRRVTIGEPQKY